MPIRIEFEAMPNMLGVIMYISSTRQPKVNQQQALRRAIDTMLISIKRACFVFSTDGIYSIGAKILRRETNTASMPYKSTSKNLITDRNPAIPSSTY